MTTDFFPYKIENKNSTCPSVFVKCNCMYEFCGSVWCSKSASCSFLFHQCHINNGSVKGVLTRGRQNGEGRETNSLKCSDTNSHTIKSLDRPMVALIVDIVDRLMMMAAWAQKLSVINMLFFTSIKEKKTQKINLFCWSSLLSMVSSFEFYYGWLKSLKTQFRVIDIFWIFLLPAFKKIKAQIVIAIVLTCLYLEGVWVHADTPPDSTPVPLTKFFCYIFFFILGHSY